MLQNYYLNKFLFSPRYFTAQIQTDKQEKRRIVCFTPGKHAMFQVASESKDVFRLNNAKITPSKDGQLEVKVFNETELIKSPKKLAFTKAYGTVFSTEGDLQETTNLVDIKSDFQMVSRLMFNLECLLPITIV